MFGRIPGITTGHPVTSWPDIRKNSSLVNLMNFKRTKSLIFRVNFWQYLKQLSYFNETFQVGTHVSKPQKGFQNCLSTPSPRTPAHSTLELLFGFFCSFPQHIVIFRKHHAALHIAPMHQKNPRGAFLAVSLRNCKLIKFSYQIKSSIKQSYASKL